MAIPANHRANIGRGTMFIAGSLATALVGAPVGIYVATHANTIMIVQQQTLADLQNFENTGAQLDNRVSGMSDALVDGRGVNDARRALRDAVSAHSSAAFALRDDMGGDYPPYATKLRELRNFADKANTPREGVKVFQSLVDLIALRKDAAGRIKLKVAGK
ncbi:hypothetical protein HMP06_0210 [Sphingomonas sp. HMP6]|nr:hypothetical protein HMP06_0210 [Sphingomonas sp. HMP6]